jgi:protein gp37
MAAFSDIEWTTHTFNPWMGCQKVSLACDNCYAECLTKRYGHVEWGPHANRKRTSPTNWRKPFSWNRAAERDGYVARVFCASLADVFDNHTSVDPAWREELFAMVKATEFLDWQILTKRPQNLGRMLPTDWGDAREYMNVWLGTTTENQQAADRRIPHLIKTPARIHFLSVEPMLGPVEPDLSKIDWVICGGESGGGKRPMNLDWARALRDQCATEGVAFFMKQVDKVKEIPADLLVRQFPCSNSLAEMAAAQANHFQER